ncbi:hypothetical protein CHS0354_020940 [Potamilus streckersoni]|uniref:ABC-type glutathione-S-conjugate transporter n=1 Tax=Potamilus streckersoni TaxID=2493646 RepID=A0AAE0W142_9BIVA|nr:hypothetical protein CHS0354_020940 [Potamilus streckersoni]
MVNFCASPLLDQQLLFNNSWPQFTDCFQNTVLVYLPCGWLWITSPVYLYYLKVKAEGSPGPLTLLNLTKTFLSLILCVLAIVDVIGEAHDKSQGKPAPPSVFLAGALKAATFALATILIQLERWKGFITSGVLWMFWFLLVIVGVVPFYSLIALRNYEDEFFSFVIFFLYYAVLLAEFVLHCFADLPSKKHYKDVAKKPCPETSASFLSRITYWWLNSMIIKGYRKGLDEKSLWDLHPRDKSEKVVPEFLNNWDKAFKKSKLCNKKKGVCVSFRNKTMEDGQESEKEKVTFLDIKDDNAGKKAPSLFKVLAKTYWLDMVYSWLCKLVYDISQFGSPMILSFLIAYVQKKNSPEGGEPEWKGYVFAILLLVLALVQSVFSHQNFHIAMTCGMRLKSALIAAIYRKALSMNYEAKKASTVGEIINLISVDCERIQMICGFLWMLWSAPLQIIIATILLWSVLGPSVLAGIGILLLLLPVNAVISLKQRKLQVQQMKHKDARIKLINEILNGIKVLKLYAWEPSFIEKVKAIRKKELKMLQKGAYLSIVSSFIWTTAPYMVTLATYATYVFTSESHFLDAQKAFVSLSLFNILRFPISLLPQIVSYVIQANVSIVRIGKFLGSDDLDPENVAHTKDTGIAIGIENGTFTWDSESEPVLKNISLEIPKGKLIAVVGLVGSGKSSLIAAVLGEMDKVTGKVTREGSSAYVPQQAWMQNATLRDNILFGKTFEEHKYRQVIDACALRTDLEILPGGDQTEIGEKGINLSGGQKQRVSLARAVFNNAEIYLLDDPLSAVDSHVGKHIFDKVIGHKGLLRNKTRVLVTHGVQWLPMVDEIIVLSNGQVCERGTFEELLNHNGACTQFIRSHYTEQSKKKEEDIDPEVQQIRNRVFKSMVSVLSESGISMEDDVPSSLPSKKQLAGRPKLMRTISCIEEHPGGDELDLGEVKQVTEVTDPTGEKLIEAEKMEQGGVKMAVYLKYFKAIGGISTIFIFLFFILYNAANVGSSVWLSAWTDDKYLKENTDIANTSEYQARNNMYLGVYAAFGLTQAIVILIYAVLFAVCVIKASIILHEGLLTNIFRAPMTFFDTTPLGRIVNRFSKDIETVDNNLPQTLRMWMNTFFTSLSTLIVISYSTPIFLAVIVPLGILYYLIQRFYIPTSRQLKRIESTTRSPVYTHFGEILVGTSTVRAYGLTDRFITEAKEKVDHNQVFYFAGIASNRWLGLRLEFIGNLIVFAAAIFAVVSSSSTGGMVGLSISYALQVTGALNFMVRMSSDLESNIVSVERVKEYMEIATEADWVVENHRPIQGWPEKGRVQFDDYSCRYREGLDLVLKGITVDIEGGQMVGIVGRTGAGKSSLTVALFRLIESAGGSITIDGQKISEIGLHDLRSRLTILPQEPVLFSGSLKMNLDPFDQYSDDLIWKALEQAHLKKFVSDLPDGLQYDCGEGGQNLSVGQRQLVCLARTLLHKTSILVLDEATAAVDMETDDLIQKTIRTEFRGCTILTIAHRLNTIMDYDKIMVLDKGLIKEFDVPGNLLKNPDSIFFSMARDANLI